MEDNTSHMVRVGGSGYDLHSDVESHLDEHNTEPRKVTMVSLWRLCAILFVYVCMCVCVCVHLFWTLILDLYIKISNKARR